MIEPAVRYHLSYTPRVIEAFATLVASIADLKLQKKIVDAAKEIDIRLRI